MDDPSCLRSPVLVLTDSLRDQSPVSIHDLLDAYATFALRIRIHGQLLSVSDTLLPALAFLRTRKDDFVCALRRDVRLAHTDPFPALFPPDGIRFEPGIHLNISIPAMQYARDSSSLCHHALCALTTIFRFPAFFSILSEHDLSLLFGDVLDIALADQLPILNQAKTYSLALWALTSHRLPAAILNSRQDDLFSALQRSLDAATQPINIVLDGIKAISHTLDHHPSAFLLLSPLLPSVMSSLHCEPSELSFWASVALGNFANAFISHSDLSSAKWQTLSNHITFFFESFCDESRLAPEDTGFSRMVHVAFSAESHAHPTDAAARILAVLASLIVLCGPTLYRKPMVLRIILQSLAAALTHKRSVIRALHPHVWKCFVWTFSQMLLDLDNIDPAIISSAFHAIRQEVTGGIGIALVNALLSDRLSMVQSDQRGDRVSRALLVIEAMVQAECKHTRREGFICLQAFTNDEHARQQITQNACEIPALVLLNGAIARADWDSLPSIIRAIPKVSVVVHWPEETEIVQHHEALLVIWKHFAIKVDERESDSSLLDVWLSILLACSRQLESGQHVIATTEVLISSAATVTEFLPSVPLGERQPDWGSWNVRDQLCRLTFIDQLWSAMGKAFASLSLVEAAELILTSVLKYSFHVLDPGVRTLWGRLCASLVVTASPSFLRDGHDLLASQLIIRSQRELWGVVATSLSSSEHGLDWKELVRFLAIPICSWILSGPELQAWEALLRNAITISGDSVIMTEILQCLQGKEVENWESIVPVLGFLLTSCRNDANLPADELLSIVNVSLTVSYSRVQHSLEALPHSLGLLNVIRCVIVSVPGRVIHILRALCSGLCLWIEDRAEVMSDDEFNSMAVSLYCDTLKVLQDLPLSTQSLQDMENFIAAAFSRIPTPAIAPFAFEKFWRATYHGRNQFYNNLPLKIRDCLTCFVAAYGGDLADGLSLATESQSQSIDDDSQARFPTSRQYQEPEVSDKEIASWHKHQPTFVSQEDTTFLMPSPGGDALQPTVLRQLQEYSSCMDASSLDESERLGRNPQTHHSSTFSPSNATPSSLTSKRTRLVTTYVPIQKRKLAESDDGPRKRSRISRSTLRAVRELESEPATRDVTPIDVPRMNSVPLRKRIVFDGVQVPTLRAVRRCQKMVQKAGTSKNAVSTEQDPASVPQTPSPRSSRRKSKGSPSISPRSVGSDEDDFDWEDFRVQETSSEVDVDEFLVDAHPSTPLRSRASTPHELDDESHLPSGSNLHKAMSQSEIPLSPPPRPSLRRAKTTSARLDALQDVYSSVANGASQIPMSELLQATRLVHQIGAVLTEQMGKKMRGPADDACFSPPS